MGLGSRLSLLLLLVLCWTIAATSARPAAFSVSAARAKPLNCSTIHRACKKCQLKTLTSGKTRALCRTCASGWRLRQDSKLRTCDCNVGMTMDANGWCELCPAGLWCKGGSASNPTAEASSCPDGLATKAPGAKTKTQCFTTPGYGRYYAGDTMFGQLCEPGTYNSGGNSQQCMGCGQGLTTKESGATSSSQCVAAPGKYVDTSNGAGRSCPKGTYTDDYNTQTSCIPCAEGFTTASEGSTSWDACSRVVQGRYITGDGNAALCQAGTYQPDEGTIFECQPCPNGLTTQGEGATGVADCSAPPGWELKQGASSITQCELGYIKDSWGRAACLPCGVGLTTNTTGSVSLDQCRIPPGWGIKSLNPLEAEPCVNNRYGDEQMRPVASNARCVLCTAGMYTMDFLLGENSTGYTSELACVVRPGEGWAQSGMVEPCAVGQFNAGYNRLSCNSCAAGFTTKGIGSLSEQDCVVQKGWALDPKLGLPQPCDVGSWSSGGTSANPGGKCESCPAGFTTVFDEAVGPEECTVCRPGYGGPVCGVCPYNTFSQGGNAAGAECATCPDGYVSARRSTDVTYCITELVSAERDYFDLNDTSQWVQELSATTLQDCQEACRDERACILYSFTDRVYPSVCNLLLEVSDGEQLLALKVGWGVDYALYRVPSNLEVGVLVQDAGDKALQGCIDACTATRWCEIASLPAAALQQNSTAGLCKLYGSEYASDWHGMLHGQGFRLFSDRFIPK